ncbi:hypothetical protein IKG50_03265 [Candidatus Saccharibacteria bacterium]|nr:hypothetical protein [Candidatus Saccharibacteria bacterium]
MKSICKKKVFVSVGVAFLSLLIVGVIAYSHDSSLLRSLFGLGYYRTVHVEEFTSPQDWKTCDITPKTVITKNESNYDIAVRLSLEEFWKGADGETDLPLVKDGVTLADIHFQNQNDWELTDGYYYYKNDLAPGESTNSLLEAVQLSCDANMTPGDNICTETATGTECVAPENPYSGATYHLKVTVETIQAEGKDEWLPSEEGTIYGEIKEKAEENGVDTNVAFDTPATNSSGNGNGVNIHKGTEGDRFPIMYYRGQVEDNNVIWGGFCWKILRTTETGGTKLFYNGLVKNNQCSNEVTGTLKDNSLYDRPVAGEDLLLYRYPYNDINREGVDEYDSPLGYGGYMFDDLQLPEAWRHDDMYRLGDTIYVSRGIEYGEDRKYHLMNPQQITVAVEGEDDDGYILTNVNRIVEDGYYYACIPVTATQCDRAAYSVAPPFYSQYGKSGGLGHFVMVDGDLLPDLRRKIAGSNQFDSVAKIAIEAWYEENIKNRPFEKDLEDTVFCNDRSLTDWPLKGQEYPLIRGFIPEEGGRNIIPFESGVRMFRTHTVSYNCANSDDRFTVSEANGNGKLKYPIALMTGDEMVAAGVFSGKLEYDSSVPEFTGPYPFGLKYWGFSMTPLYKIGMGSGGNGMAIYFGNMEEYNRAGPIEFGEIIRPSLSLKHGTKFVEGGEGTLENPYVVE